MQKDERNPLERFFTSPLQAIDGEHNIFRSAPELYHWAQDLEYGTISNEQSHELWVDPVSLVEHLEPGETKRIEETPASISLNGDSYDIEVYFPTEIADSGCTVVLYSAIEDQEYGEFVEENVTLNMHNNPLQPLEKQPTA